MNSSRFLIPCLALLALAFVSSPASAQVSISLDIAPPPLIVEDQPPVPDDGYIWTPGYWAYDQDQGAYYWVSGAWVQPPEVGFLWTPNYWGWDNNAYVYHPGYWGPTVGFYGGVNYGHGYWGNGYGGGRWNNGHFAYNRAANNVGNVHVSNAYEDRGVVRPQGNRVSFNGGHGGINAKPTPQDQQAMQQSHAQPTAQQQSHFQTAAQQRSHAVKVNAHNQAATPNAGGAQPQAQPQPAAPQPQANSPSAQKFTGENAEQKKEQHASNPANAPVQPQVKQEEKPNPITEQHAPVQKENAPSPGQQAKREEKAAPEVQHAPAESHAAQGSMGEVKSHPDAGPSSAPHPQAQAPHPQGAAAPHPEAKAQGSQPQGDAHQGGGGQPDKHQ